MSRLGLFAVVACAVVLAGCAGPERKLGRGINNMLEFTRGGEIRRSTLPRSTLYVLLSQFVKCSA